MIDLEAIHADNLERDVPNPNIDTLIAEVERLKAIFECVHCSVRHEGHLCEQHELEAALA